MSKFDNIACPVCGEVFNEKSDAVVCPDCGTPHHRECYVKNAECVNAYRHESGYVWRAPAQTITAVRADRISEGKNINVQDNNGSENVSENDWFKELQELMKNKSQISLDLDNVDNKNGGTDTRDIFGVSEREIAFFQGRANPFLLEHYRRMACEGKVMSLNFFAGLFFPYYQFFYRMRGVGIVLALIAFITEFPDFVHMLDTFGVVSVKGISDVLNTELLTKMSSFLSFARVLFMIFVTIFFDYFHLRWMASKIKYVRAKFERNSNASGVVVLDENYYSQLRSVGKPSFLIMLLDTLISSGIFAVITIFVVNSLVVVV